MRLIDADALVEKAYWHGEHPDVGNPFAEGVEAVDMSDIDNAPTIEAEPVRHGRCDFCKDGKSFIGARLLLGNDGKWHEIKYCPNCGAKMDEEVAGEDLQTQ